ncbi:MAG: DUF362 domain-containing protein [Bacteroidales bacterium]|nr:DUF362 domain-containing protein [Bacteroidales bacterium]
MAQEVFFSSLKNKTHKSPLHKISKLLKKVNVKGTFEEQQLIAVKVHFGELGNTAFLRPVFLRPVIGELKDINTRPYLTDTNTLYVGMRTNSVDHLYCANWNGFGYSTLQVPTVIADGLRGENSMEVEVNLSLSDKVHLASDIINADGIMFVSHFKGHELSGIGGAIKNLSMGCASRQGKLDMHSISRPSINQEKCTGCAQCVDYCNEKAIELSKTAYITENCVGCARCIGVCPEGAIEINFDASSENIQKKMAEYAYGVKSIFGPRMLYINVITNVAPGCDCDPANDEPLVPDIGFLASTDPVAIDRASHDLVKKANGGSDPFREFYPHLNPTIQLEYAGEIGLGTNDYKLVEV